MEKMKGKRRIKKGENEKNITKARRREESRRRKNLKEEKTTKRKRSGRRIKLQINRRK
jgi:hypothetical protein